MYDEAAKFSFSSEILTQFYAFSRCLLFSWTKFLDLVNQIVFHKNQNLFLGIYLNLLISENGK